mmetsp:Transcript_22948/g.71332  ORF Transcript_22948/g.71332 Transcript_22948/m.71332 type:complete len:428 (-) Transcript_22948:757-2040(-)
MEGVGKAAKEAMGSGGVGVGGCGSCRRCCRHSGYHTSHKAYSLQGVSGLGGTRQRRSLVLRRVPPDEDAALLTRRDDPALVRRELDRLDRPTVSPSGGLHDAVIVVPDLDQLVRTAAHEGLAGLVHVDGAHLGVGRVEDADHVAMDRVPVRDLVVRAAGEQLALVRVVLDAIEYRRLEERRDAHVALQVPDDAAAVARGGHGAAVVRRDHDGVDGTPVLLHVEEQTLVGRGNVPDTHAAVHAARDDAPGRALHVVAGHRDGRHGLGVGVAHDEEQLARLWRESADLPVAPAGDDAGAIVRDAHAIALQVHDLDAQQLHLLLRAPHADVRHGARDEQVRAVLREDNVVNASVVARALELRVELLGKDVAVGLVGADVEAVAFRRAHDARHRADDLRRHALDLVHGRVHVGHGTVTAAHEVVRGPRALV